MDNHGKNITMFEQIKEMGFNKVAPLIGILHHAELEKGCFYFLLTLNRDCTSIMNFTIFKYNELGTPIKIKAHPEIKAIKELKDAIDCYVDNDNIIG